MGAPLLPPIFVNGVEIPAEAIATEAQNHPAPPGKPGLAWRAAARALALRAALLDEARSRGVQAVPQELVPGQVETEDEAQVRALMERAIDPPEPVESDLRAHWAANPDQFRAPDLWEAAHILLAAPPENTEARDNARGLAKGIADSLAADPGRFAELAARHSGCSSRSSGGHLGQIGAGDTVAEFEATLRQLLPGQITAEPVETRFGFHVIRLDAHARGDILPFEAVRPRLEAAAKKVLWAKAAKAFAAEVMGRAVIVGL